MGRAMTTWTPLRREVPLVGGSTNAGRVSRVGDTVRRPDRPTSASTKALLDHLEQVGFAGAPRYLGIDGDGREVLTYIPGEAAIDPTPAWALSDAALISVAQLLRDYHDAVSGFDPSPHRWSHTVPERFRTDVVSHNDPNLDNIIFQDGRAVALIDFDLASPGSRVWDLACTARLWVPLREIGDVPDAVRHRSLERLGLFADAYGADREQRAGLVDAVAECHRWCYAIVREAVINGHPTFSHKWHAGGRALAARTGKWLAAHAGELHAALDVS